MGLTSAHKVMIFDELMDSNPLFLTGNTDTVYAITLFTPVDGPTVVEVPPRCGPGTVNDAFFRSSSSTWVARSGPRAGREVPDRAPSDYDGEIPEGCFVGRSSSSVNLLVLRGLLVDGKPDVPTKNFTEGLRIYPLSQAAAPPAMEFLRVR